MRLQSEIINEFNAVTIEQFAKKTPTFFDGNADINKNAFLNWRMDRKDDARCFVSAGEAYLTSSIHLTKECLRNNEDKKADSWIFPILFNMVHGIEVYLKAICATYSTALGKPRKITGGGHDIQGLCGEAQSLIAEFALQNPSGEMNQAKIAIMATRKFIDTIYEKTRDMTFARYPLDKDANGHFYIETLENEVVNLEALKTQLVHVHIGLSFAYEVICTCFEFCYDQLSDCYA